MRITKEQALLAGTHHIAVNGTAKSFKLKPVEVDIMLTCYLYDLNHKDNDTFNIAFRLGKKKENYLYKFIRGLETKGYLFGQQALMNKHGKGRIAKCYKCTNKAIQIVDEFFIQSESYGS